MKKKKIIQDQVKEQFPEFAEELNGLSVDALNNRLAQLAKEAEAVQEAKEADDELAEARSNLLQLNAPYTESKKAIRLRSRYLIALLKDKGAK